MSRCCVYLNLGNTACQWGLWDEGQWLAEGRLPRRDPEALPRHVNQAALALRPAGSGPCEVAAVASLAAVEPWRELVLAAWGRPLLVLGRDFQTGLRTVYDRPAEWGQDRQANVLAALQEGAAPCLVLDAGTCLTLDVVNAAGEHQGGVIAPGLPALRAGLVAGAAHLESRLPDAPLVVCPPRVGSGTEESLALGLGLTLAGTVRLLEEYGRTVLGGTPRVLLTGGDGPLLLRFVPEAELRPRLTLDGLRLAHEHARRAGG